MLALCYKPPLQTLTGLLALQDAEAEGCKTVSGLEMFVGQAAQQFELFTGQQAPKDLMRKATLDSMSAH